MKILNNIKTVLNYLPYLYVALIVVSVIVFIYNDGITECIFTQLKK